MLGLLADVHHRRCERDERLRPRDRVEARELRRAEWLEQLYGFVDASRIAEQVGKDDGRRSA
jgi:hypothetical protein